MKKIIGIFITAIIGINVSVAQCSQTPNDFEIRLLPIGNNKLSVQMRHHNDAVPNAESKLPNSTLRLDGLIFAISWPNTSTEIVIVDCKSDTKPFDLMMDKSIAQNNTLNKNLSDHMQTFYHNNSTSLPTAFSTDWKPNEWYSISTISYSGKLSKNDFFSLINCDYGIAHPNSYSGNSNTDPWFALLNTDNKYLQFSPKMITELPKSLDVNNSFTIYPNPATTEFNIEIDVEKATGVAVKIMDESGKVVKIIAMELQAGKNKNTIVINELASGNYLVKLTDGKTINIVQKLQKL